MGSEGWKPLAALSNVGTDAPLLIKHTFTATSYNVSLTDLSYVWSESLDRRQIIRRALDTETSIDPSEGTDQLHLLLQKINGALAGQYESKLVLSWSGKDKDLVLEISASLPAPLRSLEWRLCLLPAPPAVLTTELLLPCLYQQVLIIGETRSLLESLKEKDHVISRLVDRLQSTGIELSSVFPGAAGVRSTKNANSREVAARTIKGLGEFDEAKWRKDLRTSFSPPTRTSELIEDVFSSNISESLEINAKQEVSMWWKRLKNGKTSSDQTPMILSFRANSTSSPKSSRNSDDNTGFQRHNTPDRVRSSSSSRANNASSIDRHQRKAQSSPEMSRQSDASTDDEEDGDVHLHDSNLGAAGKNSSNQYHSTPQPNSPFSSKLSSASPQKLGLVEGMHRKPSFLKEPPFLMSPSPAGKRYAGSETDPGGSRSSTERDLNYRKSPMKTKSRLGTIGGRNKESQARDRPADVEEKSPVLLGERGRDIDEGGAMHMAETRRSQSPVRLTSIKPVPPIPPRESSQERADKKRELLKRQLEEKAKVATKKKRKF